MNEKTGNLAPVCAYPYSKCPTSRNMNSERNSFDDRGQSNYLFPGYIKGDDRTNYLQIIGLNDQTVLPSQVLHEDPPISQRWPSESLQPMDQRFESRYYLADPEIVIDAVVFRRMSRLHQRDGLFLQKIGILRIRK